MAKKKKSSKKNKTAPNPNMGACYNVGQFMAVMGTVIEDAMFGVVSKDRARVKRSLIRAQDMVSDLLTGSDGLEDTQFLDGLYIDIEEAIMEADTGFFFPQEELAMAMNSIMDQFGELEAGTRENCRSQQDIPVLTYYGGEE